jgi:hypothetical protein
MKKLFNTLFGLFIIILIASFFAVPFVIAHKEHKKLKELREKYVAKKIIINKDTLTIARINKRFVLSNGIEIDKNDICKFKVIE